MRNRIYCLVTTTFVVAFSSYTATNTFAETHVVGAYNLTFVPDVVTVAPGDVIRWEYVAGAPHTVTSGTNCFWDGLFHHSLASFDPVFEWTVPNDAPSEIPYLCLPHCSAGMTAVIYVVFDCNGNGTPDAIDIKTGESEDVNSDGIPDECQCLADVTGDGIVNVNDILALIGAWGSTGPVGDVNADDIVDVNDLLIVISSWGSCA